MKCRRILSFALALMLTFSIVQALAAAEVWGRWTTEQEATCTQTGIQTRKSNLGNVERREIPMRPHTPGEWELTEATCIQESLRVQRCTVCHEVIAQETTGYYGPHQWGDWEEVDLPPGTLYTLEKRVCQVCGKTEEQQFPLAVLPTQPEEETPELILDSWYVGEGPFALGQEVKIRLMLTNMSDIWLYYSEDNRTPTDGYPMELKPKESKTVYDTVTVTQHMLDKAQDYDMEYGLTHEVWYSEYKYYNYDDKNRAYGGSTAWIPVSGTPTPAIGLTGVLEEAGPFTLGEEVPIQLTLRNKSDVQMTFVGTKNIPEGVFPEILLPKQIAETTVYYTVTEADMKAAGATGFKAVAGYQAKYKYDGRIAGDNVNVKIPLKPDKGTQPEISLTGKVISKMPVKEGGQAVIDLTLKNTCERELTFVGSNAETKPKWPEKLDPGAEKTLTIYLDVHEDVVAECTPEGIYTLKVWAWYQDGYKQPAIDTAEVQIEMEMPKSPDITPPEAPVTDPPVPVTDPPTAPVTDPPETPVTDPPETPVTDPPTAPVTDPPIAAGPGLVLSASAPAVDIVGVNSVVFVQLTLDNAGTVPVSVAALDAEGDLEALDNRDIIYSEFYGRTIGPEEAPAVSTYYIVVSQSDIDLGKVWRRFTVRYAAEGKEYTTNAAEIEFAPSVNPNGGKLVLSCLSDPPCIRQAGEAVGGLFTLHNGSAVPLELYNIAIINYPGRGTDPNYGDNLTGWGGEQTLQPGGPDKTARQETNVVDADLETGAVRRSIYAIALDPEGKEVYSNIVLLDVTLLRVDPGPGPTPVPPQDPIPDPEPDPDPTPEPVPDPFAYEGCLRILIARSSSEAEYVLNLCDDHAKVDAKICAAMAAAVTDKERLEAVRQGIENYKAALDAMTKELPEHMPIDSWQHISESHTAFLQSLASLQTVLTALGRTELEAAETALELIRLRCIDLCYTLHHLGDARRMDSVLTGSYEELNEKTVETAFDMFGEDGAYSLWIELKPAYARIEAALFTVLKEATTGEAAAKVFDEAARAYRAALGLKTALLLPMAPKDARPAVLQWQSEIVSYADAEKALYAALYPDRPEIAAEIACRTLREILAVLEQQ